MEINQITDIIKAHPNMPYAEAKSQAVEVGLSTKDFQNAWDQAKKEGLSENDRHIQEMIKEMRSMGIGTKKILEWKAYFKKKGYLDDEVDLANVLVNAEIDYFPFSSWKTMVVIVLLIAVVIYFLNTSYKGVLSGDSIEDLIQIGFLVVVGYLGYLAGQFRKYTGKVIRLDFDAKPAKMLQSWKVNGSKLLNYPAAQIINLFEMEYDKRQTFYGEYQYTVGSGKHRRTYSYAFIAQKAHKKLPLVHCFSPSLDRSFFKKEVKLEGNELNKKYNIYAKNPTDAFYVLNPRVMNALLEGEVLKALKSFETVGDFIIMSFANLTLHTGIRFKGPIIRFKDYNGIKTKMLHHLDLASDLNDILSRLIVDSGEGRTVAKEK